MKVQQLQFLQEWKIAAEDKNFDAAKASLVLSFGILEKISQPEHFEYLQNKYPNANIVMATDCGQILKEEVYEDSIVSNAFEFESAKAETLNFNIKNFENSYSLGKSIANSFDATGLKLLLVIADGILVNGSDLVSGIREHISDGVIVTGGLAGDNAAFIETKVGLNESPKSGQVVAVAFYGESLQIGFGSFGGFDAFGTERKVTKSVKNTVYEIDGKRVLDLYKEYLGEYAAEFPGSALPFPLGIIGQKEPLVRTVLGVDEAEGSITFAGNINEGDTVRMMKANFSKLFDAATTSATNALVPFGEHSPKFALLISCVGRKMVLRERVEEEIETSRNILGGSTFISGFYSYGEVSPISNEVKCELFNQTMTITTIGETV
jgi:hypothetical protein